jgi:hypothetical protein
MIRLMTLTTTALVLALAPAVAASSFYVVRPPHSKRCSIQQTAPNGKTLLLVGKPHSSRSSASRAMHTSVSCTQTKKGSS